MRAVPDGLDRRAEHARATTRRPSAACRSRVDLPAVGPERRGGRGALQPVLQRRARGARGQQPGAAIWRLVARLKQAPTRRTTTCGASRATSTTASHTPRRRRARRARWTASCSTPSRLLPAVLRRRGAAAADGRRAGARRDRLHERRARRQGGEFVVRDFDAHSWVEAWFPGYGWVTRDPTPAAAPPRAQPGERLGREPVGPLPGVPNLGGERLSDLRATRARAAGEGTNWLTYAIVGLSRRCCSQPGRSTSAAAAGACRRPRSARWPSSSARCGAPATTAARDDAVRHRARFAGWPGAAGYVRALREQRYSGRQAPRRPSSAAACARRSRATRGCCARGGRCRRAGPEGDCPSLGSVSSAPARGGGASVAWAQMSGTATIAAQRSIVVACRIAIAT